MNPVRRVLESLRSRPGDRLLKEFVARKSDKILGYGALGFQPFSAKYFSAPG